MRFCLTDHRALGRKGSESTISTNSFIVECRSLRSEPACEEGESEEVVKKDNPIEAGPQPDLNSCRPRERAKRAINRDNRLRGDAAEHPHKPNKNSRSSRSKRKQTEVMIFRISVCSAYFGHKLGTNRISLIPGLSQVVDIKKRPQRDLNSCRRRERAVS